MTDAKNEWVARVPPSYSISGNVQWNRVFDERDVRSLVFRCNEELNAARARIVELEAKNINLLDMCADLHGKLDRRPMECAPRDGKQVLLYDKYEDAFVAGEWLEKRKMWLCGYDANGDWNLCADGDFSGWWPWPDDAVEAP